MQKKWVYQRLEAIPVPTLRPNSQSSQFASHRKQDELLLEGSQRLDWWLNLGQFKHETKFYIFNVTNPEEAKKPLHAGGEKIRLDVTGPFKFEQKLVYDVDSWDEDLEHMNIRIKTIYSALNHRELEITTLNFPLVAVYKLVDDVKGISWEQKSHIFMKVIPKFEQKLFITKNSDELLFEGYEDPSIFLLLEAIEKEFRLEFGIRVDLTLPPSIVKDGRFSLMASVSGVLVDFNYFIESSLSL